MTVSLIDYTGKGSPDIFYAARLLIYTKQTRLEQGPETREAIAEYTPERIHEELALIANTIRSSWEFIDYTFEIRGVTRAFTHQFVRTRTGSYAQQTHRALKVDAGNVIMPGRVEAKAEDRAVWNNCVNEIRDAYEDLIAHGIPMEDARGLLPTNISTNIIAKFNLRTLADLVAKRENLRAQGEYNDVAKGMARCILAVHPWADVFLHPDRLATPTLDALLKNWLAGRSAAQVPEIAAALKELDKLKGTWG